jgi:hypothetical protein
MGRDDKPKITEIDFHYLRAPNYRSYHVDGMIGGPTPSGNIYIDLFLEKKPTPSRVKNKVTNNGEIGDEIERDSEDGFIREIECGLVMDINSAKAFRDWLSRKIEAIDSLIEENKNNSDESKTGKDDGEL